MAINHQCDRRSDSRSTDKSLSSKRSGKRSAPPPLKLKLHLFRFSIPWLPEVFLFQTDGIGKEKPLVQAVELFEKAGPMGCRFIFPESDFDPSNSIGFRNLSVLTSTLVGLATESSSNRFSIAFNQISHAAAHCGHNRNAAKFLKSRL